MTVFDVAGREVVKLLDNELLGATGAVSWNGIMEDGNLGRMGPYVVVFEAFDLNGNAVHIGVSIGIVLYPDHGTDAAALLRHADLAMYQAKALGRNNVQRFQPSLLNQRPATVVPAVPLQGPSTGPSD